MEFTLARDLFDDQATPGKFFRPDGSFLAFSLERPWLNNQRQISCIPAGRYRLKKRYSQKFGWHLWLQNVPDRSLILIHTANYVRQLQGCIAPGLKKGDTATVYDSAKAVKAITALAFPALDQGQEVWLTITNPPTYESNHQQSGQSLASVPGSAAHAGSVSAQK